ncbi:MAG: hypothetical protein ACPG4T_07975 [Nannocystaceae bacterium]
MSCACVAGEDTLESTDTASSTDVTSDASTVPMPTTFDTDFTTTGVDTSDPPVTTVEPTTFDPSTTDDSSDSEDSDSDSDATTGPSCPEGPPPSFDYIWIPNSAQGTISKINTHTALEEARYRTSAIPGDPSRTSINQYGDLAVSNRVPGSITKIAGHIDRCIDKDKDGSIDTSMSKNDVLAWDEEECILWNTEIPSYTYQAGPRPTAWEWVQEDPETCETAVPRLWSGYMDESGTAHFIRLDGESGDILDDVTYDNWPGGGFGPYGGAANRNGDLIAIGINKGPMVRIDAQTLQLEEFPVPDTADKYGLALDQNGNVWTSATNANDNMFHYDFDTEEWTALGSGGGDWLLGVAVDFEGRVWSAGTSPCRLVQADVDDVEYKNTHIELAGCGQPWGISVDNEGYIWVVDRDSIAFKVDPDTHVVVATVTGLSEPFSYSDMTGLALQLVIE